MTVPFFTGVTGVFSFFSHFAWKCAGIVNMLKVVFQKLLFWLNFNFFNETHFLLWNLPVLLKIRYVFRQIHQNKCFFVWKQEFFSVFEKQKGWKVQRFHIGCTVLFQIFHALKVQVKKAQKYKDFRFDGWRFWARGANFTHPGVNFGPLRVAVA